MILVIGFYQDPDEARRREFLDCIRHNAANDLIREIHVFTEDVIDLQPVKTAYPELRDPKVRLVPLGHRLTYREMLTHANGMLAGQVVIIANADIYFDQTLKELLEYDLSGRFLCLSRWDVRQDGTACLFEHTGSQDAWIFRVPVPGIEGDFWLGLPGSDNRLAWEVAAAGLLVLNPGRSIRANHLHLSQIHRYNERNRLHGLTLPVPARYLGTAEVAFRESMGYSIARLEAGVSSHTNESRPILAIPEPLLGRAFTQVVANRASPVEIEFLTSGRIYVLVATGWHGHSQATDWLQTAGRRQPLPDVETENGGALEIWSLTGSAGQSFTIPTQVTLVADRLVSRDP